MRRKVEFEECSAQTRKPAVCCNGWMWGLMGSNHWGKSNAGRKPIHDFQQLVGVYLAWSINTVSGTACFPPGVWQEDVAQLIWACEHVCVLQRDTAGSSRPRVSASQPARRLALPPSPLSPVPLPSLLWASLLEGESSWKPLLPQLPPHHSRGERGGKKHVRC